MTFTIKTIGCKVNTYESNKIKAELINSGLIFIEASEKNEYKKLDYYIINTCSVTSIADKKSRQMIHRAKSLNKNLIVVATGCYVDAHLKDLDKDIDIFFPNMDKMRLIDFVKDQYEKEKAINDISDETHDILLPRIREFIKIQDGCNQYCTYCIIPYLRGNIKSRNDKEIIDEIKEKVKNGTREIVLTGIHLSSFGVDREKMAYEMDGAIDIGRKSLLNIIKEIADIKINNDKGGKDYLGNELAGVLEVERIRLGSLEPRIINDDFIKILASGKIGEKFCDNFCLSLQSGCDKTLKSMNRHYTTNDFRVACDTIRKYMPHATITADIIVGFPGESEDDFNESLSFVKEMRFYNPNIFPYSRRKGTKADTFNHQILNSVKHKRAMMMIEECEKITKEIEKEYNKVNHDILVEEVIEENDREYAVGYTREYIKQKIAISETESKK